MRSADVEQPEVVVRAPLHEQPKVRRVAGQRVAGVAGKEPGDRGTLADIERLVAADELDRGSGCCCGHGGLLVTQTVAGREPRLHPMSSAPLGPK